MARKRKSVETFTHDGAKRRNISTAEYQPVMRPDDKDEHRFMRVVTLADGVTAHNASFDRGFSRRNG